MKDLVFEFAKKRDFGSIIGDSLYFFTRNFKSFLLGFLTYVGPFFLLGALAMVYGGIQFGEVFGGNAPGLGIAVSALVFIPCTILASIAMMAFVCGMAQKHQVSSETPLVDGIWPYVRKNVKPAVAAMALLIALIVIPYLILIFGGLLMGAEIGIAILIFLSMPVIIYFSIPLTVFLIVHVMEDNPLRTSLKRGFYLVRDHWWSTFGVYIILSILASIASYIVVIPAYIILAIKSFGSMSAGEINGEIGVWFGITYACVFLGSLFAGMYQVLGMILQYYSLREKKEGVGLLQRIQDIDKPLNELV